MYLNCKLCWHTVPLKAAWDTYYPMSFALGVCFISQEMNIWPYLINSGDLCLYLKMHFPKSFDYRWTQFWAELLSGISTRRRDRKQGLYFNLHHLVISPYLLCFTHLIYKMGWSSFFLSGHHRVIDLNEIVNMKTTVTMKQTFLCWCQLALFLCIPPILTD